MSEIRIKDWPPYSPGDLTRREGGITVARLMANAAMTSPKGGGVDQIECTIVSGEDDQDRIARKVEQIAALNKGNKMWKHACMSEAVMAREADCILFIGNYRAGDSPFDLNCGICSGEKGCSHVYGRKASKYGQIDSTEDREKRNLSMIDGPLCSFWVGDLGYAVGSAIVISKRLLVDARPIMSIGVAGQKMNYCKRSDIVVAIPVATLQKNPFLDVMPDYQYLSLEKAISQLRKNYVVSRQVHWYSYRTWYPKIQKTEREVE